MDDARSHAGTVRVRDRKRSIDAVDEEVDSEGGINLENELSAVVGLDEAMELQPSMLSSRAAKMFTEGDGAPRTSGGEVIATVPTLWLVKLGMEAVNELFKHHRDAVHKSWGEPIDKEEALGYLVCDALGTELMPKEARRIGKDATLAITRKKTGAKVVEGQLKGAAAAKKAKARAAAKKHPERAEGLDKTLDALDAEGKAALVQL